MYGFCMKGEFSFFHTNQKFFTHSVHFCYTLESATEIGTKKSFQLDGVINEVVGWVVCRFYRQEIFPKVAHGTESCVSLADTGASVFNDRFWLGESVFDPSNILLIWSANDGVLRHILIYLGCTSADINKYIPLLKLGICKKLHLKLIFLVN